jgi:hypothetical protein
MTRAESDGAAIGAFMFFLLHVSRSAELYFLAGKLDVGALFALAEIKKLPLQKRHKNTISFKVHSRRVTKKNTTFTGL